MSPCYDPWPPVYDFQAFSDKSIEPPPEPLPLRYNLDAIWGNGPDSGTTADFAAAPTPAPDDATRLQALLQAPPYYALLGKMAAFPPLPATIDTQVTNLTTIVHADYDGTFLPSSSVRTVTPPDEGAELTAVNRTDNDMTSEPIWTPPWATQKGV